jgi:MoxR-like ATPase
MSILAEQTNNQVQEARQWVEPLVSEVSKVVVGQKKLVHRLLAGLLCNGHVLLEGVPGLAKTLTVRTLASCIRTGFQRIQFTPDLLPADLIGTLIYNPRDGEFTTKLGPIFSNLILADEINRAPAKVQSALLEAMQERQVTISDTSYPLSDPFLVLATQNPIEQEGTYPLPEAQLDRFMFQIDVGYPSAEEEVRIVNQMTTAYRPTIRKVLTPERILELQDVVLRVPAAPHVVQHAVALCRATRPTEASAPELVKKYVSWGAGPRASQYLVLAAKARAVLHGRYAVALEDIRALAPPVLIHRVVRNFHAEADGVTPRAIVDHVVESIKPV